MADLQRARLVAAFAQAVAEHGYAELEVEQVLRYAGVSRATFEAHFESKEAGLIAAQDAFFERLWLDVIAARDVPGDWPVKVRAALAAILSTVVEASALARVFAIEAAAVSFAAVERQFAAFDQLAHLLRDGRRHFPRAASLPALTERALVGGVVSIVAGHLLAESPQALSILEGQIVELVLAPYIGEAEARRVAAA
ncbi:MAG TPA: TetR/AcrR family transcriptional regulator [Solirubrobacterales bacterium]|jgi:AcrR family transcriptional regulator|nr:TetR/AcrR family transcriptional regulator [Solirubrobacterales bacterium]